MSQSTLMARVQSPGDREAALKAMVETLMAQTRELQARLDSAGETIARLQRMVFGSRSERIVLSTGGSPPLPGFERMVGEAAGKDEPAKDGAVGRGGRHRGQPAAGWLDYGQNQFQQFRKSLALIGRGDCMDDFVQRNLVFRVANQ